MIVTLNGKAEDIEADTLKALVDVLELGDGMVATALNGTFVPKRKRSETALRDGDRVEIVAPMQGG